MKRPKQPVWIAVFLVIAAAGFAQPNARFLPPGFVDELMEDGFKSAPTTLAALPDGRFMIGFLSGQAFFWTPKEGLAEKPFIDTKLSYQIGIEDGVNGAALDPDYEKNRHLFVFYVTNREEGPPVVPRLYKIARFTVAAPGESPDGIAPGSEQVIFSVPDENQFSRFHVGGGITFGPDGKIYAGFGEDGAPPSAQNPNSTRGKLLRMNPDGSIPEDNPLFNGKRTLAYVLGLRNPYRNFFDTKTGQHFSCDTGQAYWEELNLIQPGKNYGWPVIEGPLKDNPGVTPPANYQDPYFYYFHEDQDIAGYSIVDGIVYDGTMFPQEYRGDIFITEWGLWKNGKIFRMKRKPDGSLDKVTIFQKFPVEHGMGDMTIAPDGSLYYLISKNDQRNTGGIRRISYRQPDNPPTCKIVASVQRGSAPLRVEFKAEIEDEGVPSVLWDFGDGTTEQIPAATKIFAAGGRYAVRLSVMDQHGSRGEATTTIEATQAAAIDIDTVVRSVGGDAPKGVGGVARFFHATGDALPLGPGGPDSADIAPDGTLRVKASNLSSLGAYIGVSIEAEGCAPRRIAMPLVKGKAGAPKDIFVSPVAISGIVRTDKGQAVSDIGVWISQKRPDGVEVPYSLVDGQDLEPPLEPQGATSGIFTGADGGYYMALREREAGQEFTVTPNVMRKKAGHVGIAQVVKAAAPPLPTAADLLLKYVSGGQGCDIILPGNNQRVEFKEIQRVFDTYCIGCHGLVNPYQGLTLAEGFSYSNIVERPSKEVPGKLLIDQYTAKSDRLGASYLVEKINCAIPSQGTTMPPTGKITGGERNLFALWVRGGAQAGPARVSAWGSQLEGEGPLAVQFRGGAEGPRANFPKGETGPLFHFEWDFGDGTASTEANPMKTFSLGPGEAAREFRVTLKASDWQKRPLGSKQLIVKVRPGTSAPAPAK